MESAGDLKRRWTWSVEWLHDELERGGPGQGHRAPYASSAGSNETANGYFLERSHSARLTLEKACELLPVDDNEAEGASNETTSSEVTNDVDRSKPAGGQETSRRPGVTSPVQTQQRMRRREEDEKNRGSDQ